MTYTAPSTPARRSTARARGGARVSTIDIAGTPWPVYKVEALILGALVFLGALALTASLQTAVLTSAATAVVAWWTLLLHEYRSQQ